MVQRFKLSLAPKAPEEMRGIPEATWVNKMKEQNERDDN